MNEFGIIPIHRQVLPSAENCEIGNMKHWDNEISIKKTDISNFHYLICALSYLK